MAAPLSAEDAALLERIAEGLRSTGQSTLHLDADDIDGIRKARTLGRRAARDLGWKVRTFAIDPLHRDAKQVVVVAVIESSPLHQQLMQVRGDKALRKAFESWDLGGQGG